MLAFVLLPLEEEFRIYLAGVVVDRVQGVARELNTASVVALHEEGILAAY